MKKCIKIILIVLSFLPFYVLAKDCDYIEKSTKKKLAANIGWSYQYYVLRNEMYFDITVTNVYDDLYVVDASGKEYSKSEFVIKGLEDNQKLSFEVHSKECDDIVATKDISLPAYNKYYSTEYCKGISEYSICNKWKTLSPSDTDEKVKAETDKYRKTLEEPQIAATEYKPNTINFYICIVLVLLALGILLNFIVRERHEKDFI